MRRFDTIDIFFIIIISIYFVALFLFVSIFIIKYIETDKEGNEIIDPEALRKKEARKLKRDAKKKERKNYRELIKNVKLPKLKKKEKIVETPKEVIKEEPHMIMQPKPNNTKKNYNHPKTRANKTKKKTPKKYYKNNISYVKNNPKKDNKKVL